MKSKLEPKEACQVLNIKKGLIYTAQSSEESFHLSVYAAAFIGLPSIFHTKYVKTLSG